MIFRKHYLDQIRPFYGTDVIKVITGMRRSGKSVILEQIRDEIKVTNPDVEIFYLDLEERRNAAYLAKDVLFNELTKILDAAGKRKVAIFLDEIHDVEEWELQVNSIRKRKNADIYITGSNSKLLSGELATYLTGRTVEFEIAPFSFGEFREATGEYWGGLSADDLFGKYLECGGLPFLTQIRFQPQASQTYLDDLYWAILTKDVMRRLKIRDVDMLDRIVRYVITEIGHVFSSRSIVRFLKNEHRTTTVETVLAYLKACEDAFLIRRVEREDLIGKRILSVDEKYYVTDLGLRRALVGDLRGEDIDQTLENVVYREFVRCGWKVTVGRVREKEVDFVCQKPGRRRYVQVCYLMPNGEKRAREFSALESVPDQYEKIVLSLDRFDFSRNGVRHAYLPDYLTELSKEE
ncbi:MAG: ATP-binding protein [bacterium]|nr:ATP-binding protein [Candidatus Colisoma equi]